jgi:hypothetical protein
MITESMINPDEVDDIAENAAAVILNVTVKDFVGNVSKEVIDHFNDSVISQFIPEYEEKSAAEVISTDKVDMNMFTMMFHTPEGLRTLAMLWFAGICFNYFGVFIKGNLYSAFCAGKIFISHVLCLVNNNGGKVPFC